MLSTISFTGKCGTKDALKMPKDDVPKQQHENEQSK